MKLDGVTLWFTGAVVRMCDCGTKGWPAKDCLQVFTDGRRNYAHCDECGKTWDVDTLKEIEQ